MRIYRFQRLLEHLGFRDHYLVCHLASALVVALMLERAYGATSVAETKITLQEFLAQAARNMPPTGTNLALEPQWVGTVERAYLRGGERIYSEDTPTNIRFTHSMVVRHFESEPRLVMAKARRGADGMLRYVGSEAPAYLKNLPSTKVVSEARNLNDLLKMFGPQHGWTSGWGGDERMHWTEGWTWFTVESKKKVRYMSVFAHVSAKKGQKPADIDILLINEGLFRPANPDSAVERNQFKTPEESFVIEQDALRKARDVYPRPLRDLVEARQAPDDSGWVTYKRALNEIRRNPRPELFGQFAEWVHEGTVEIKMMLETLLFDNRLELDKWEEQKRRLALRSLNEALPRVKTSMDLDNLIVFLLQAQGGGELNVAVPRMNARIDIKAHRFEDGGGASATYGSQNVTEENLLRAAEVCRDTLKERYSDLR